jgi:RNA polymerase sigma-70 factor (ECF subfamily)
MNFPSTHVSLLGALADQERREDAWTAFQSCYGPVILAWCMRRGLDRHTAEDLTQDILFKLVRALPADFDSARGRFRSWLKAVVNNAVADWKRDRAARLAPGGLAGSPVLERVASLEAREAVDELGSACDRRSTTWAKSILERVRARVGDATWEAFHRRLVEREPARAIAAELGVSIGAVYKAADRVRRMVIEECRDA